MAEYKLELKKRDITGKKLRALRTAGLIPSVVYGGKTPILASSEYVSTEKVLSGAGYHSPVDLDIDGKKQMAIIKDVQLDPVTRRILNVEFQAISAKEAVTATTPIRIINYSESEASKTNHLFYTQVLEGVEVKAKPADLPKELTIDGSKLNSIEDRLTIADLQLPAGVEFADKELDQEQVVASLYDPAAEAEKREAAEAAEATDAAEEATEEAASDSPEAASTEAATESESSD